MMHATPSVIVFRLALASIVFGSILFVLTLKQTPITLLTPTDIDDVTPVSFQPSPVPSPSPSPSPLVISFVGDMMFDRHIRTNAEARPNGYASTISPEVSALLQTSDLVVGNVEGPITDNSSVSVGSIVGSSRNYIFTFSPQILPVLQQHNIVANLGNNHITNMGEDGWWQTISRLDTAGVSWFSQLPYADPTNKLQSHAAELGQQSKVAVYNQDNFRLVFINYNQFGGPGLDAALKDIRDWDTQADLVVVYTHWGNEYQPLAPPVIQAQARSMIEAGADVIIGSHPHVIQNTETINGKRVYYSLGNFVFDQYFSNEVQTGLVVTATIDPVLGAMTFTEHRVWMQGGVTTLLESE